MDEHLLKIADIAWFAYSSGKTDRYDSFKKILEMSPPANIAYWCNKGLKSNTTDGRSEAVVGILEELGELKEKKLPKKK